MKQQCTQLTWGNDALQLTIGWDEHTPVHLTGITTRDVSLQFDHNIPFIEILAAGHGHWESSNRLIHTTLGAALRYETSHQWAQAGSQWLSVQQHSADGIDATLRFQLPDDCAMIRTTVEVTNNGTQPVSLESITNWATLLGSPQGTSPDLAAWTVHQARQEWLSEGRWQTHQFADLFPRIAQTLTGHDPRGQHALVSTGSWSTGSYLPMAICTSTIMQAAWFMQVEHNGPWRWEIGDCTRDAYMAASGPTLDDHSWSITLNAGESFTTVPASVSVANNMANLLEQVTTYRRVMNTAGNELIHPRVIFNDYMNTINGDPSTDKLLPLIDAAADTGCEVFCIDCGWYDDSGDWWPSVGQWRPSIARFPNGLAEVTMAIEQRGMIPGLWLEPEVIGVNSSVADQLPDEAFFCRNGQRIVEQERYMLDFSHPAAVEYITGVVDRLICDYNIGYFKFDYNVSPGAGTDTDNVSLGQGMLRHNRAYSQWIDQLHQRYPQLILENCSSGGMREDFAQTSRFQVQSTSDQQDWRHYPAIAASAPMAMLPEQAANWAYPQADMDQETIGFTLVTTMLGRFFLSGYLNQMDTAQRELCARAVDVYTTAIRPHITQVIPVWPLGLPQWDDRVVALGLRDASVSFVAVWARDLTQDSMVCLPLEHLRDSDVQVDLLFPCFSDGDSWSYEWDSVSASLCVHVPAGVGSARLFQITVLHAEV